MTIKIGDIVTVYDKSWVVDSVTEADEVEKELPDIGHTMKRLGMRLVVLQGTVKPVDLLIMQIYGQSKRSATLVDNAGNFHDPDALLWWGLH